MIVRGKLPDEAKEGLHHLIEATNSYQWPLWVREDGEIFVIAGTWATRPREWTYQHVEVSDWQYLEGSPFAKVRLTWEGKEVDDWIEGANSDWCGWGPNGNGNRGSLAKFVEIDAGTPVHIIRGHGRRELDGRRYVRRRELFLNAVDYDDFQHRMVDVFSAPQPRKKGLQEWAR